eukprot:gene27869-30919_t
MGNLTSFLPIILMFVVLYFLMIRPQMKRQKEQKAMMDALGKGDEVVTSGGLLGKVVKVADAYVTVEVSEGNEVVADMSASATYALIVVALLFGTLYTLPNFFGESPAVQISSAKSTIKVDSAIAEHVQQL